LVITEQNIFIDLIRYRSSLCIHRLHTFIRESEKVWKYKTKEEKKQTNKQNRFGNKSKAFFAPMGV